MNNRNGMIMGKDADLPLFLYLHIEKCPCVKRRELLKQQANRGSCLPGMAMIIIGGFVVASSPAVCRCIQKLAGMPKSPEAVITVVASMAISCWSEPFFIELKCDI